MRPFQTVPVLVADWFELVRALLCITLIVYVSACVIAIYDNWLAKYDPATDTPSRRVEIVTAVAGQPRHCGRFSVEVNVS